METLKKAQQFIEYSTLELSDQQDFVPFVVMLDERDREFFIGFGHMPDEPEEKDYLADMITALCIVHGAVEVAFGSSAWSAITSIDDTSDVPPSKRPNRQEVAYISAANSSGASDTSVASLIRENGKVGVGLWEQMPTAGPGRFAEALHLGIKISGKIPAEVRDFLREQIEAGLMKEVVSSTVNIIAEARRTAMIAEERLWKK